MSMQQDFFRGGVEPNPFADIRATNSRVAEEKAVLLLQLGQLINKVPDKIRGGSIQATRDWMVARNEAAKVAGNGRASLPQLSAAVSSLKRWAD